MGWFMLIVVLCMIGTDISEELERIRKLLEKRLMVK